MSASSSSLRLRLGFLGASLIASVAGSIDLGLNHLRKALLGVSELPQRAANGAAHPGELVRPKDEEREEQDESEL